MTDWSDSEHGELELGERRRPLAPTGLLPRERWRWWEQLWPDVLALGTRYRIWPGKDWWEDSTQVEALAALAAWVARYDAGEWDDPPGKLGLLYDLERVREMIRGAEVFHPDRDRGGFTRWPIVRHAPRAMTVAITARGGDAGRAAQYLITAPCIKEKTMRDIAAATLSGNLTREVEVRELPSGASVARLRIASTTRRRNGDGWVDKTNYFTVEVYGGHARACAEHLARARASSLTPSLTGVSGPTVTTNKREAVTFRARQVLIESARSTAASAKDGSDQDPGASAARAAADASPVGVPTPRGDGTASAEDLPF